MDLSIIIVNWNSTEFTRQCLASVQNNISGLVYEVIVVDNASRDDSCRVMIDSFPSAKFISADANIGFARANNLGVDHSTGNNVLFLNPDTLVRDDAIQQMVDALNAAEDLGVMGCTLLNADLSLQTTCIQPFPTVSNQLFGVDFLKQRWPELRMFGMRELYSPVGKTIAEVEVISGACLMVKRAVLESVGRFSEDYFMYAEEADLCYKIRRAGWKIGFLREAQIIHFGGQSTKKREDGFADIAMRESLFKFFRKFHGAPYALLYRAALLFGAIGRVILVLPLLAIPVRKVDARRVIKKWGRISAWSLALHSSRVGNQ